MSPTFKQIGILLVLGLFLAATLPTFAQDCTQIKQRCAQQQDKHNSPICKQARTKCGKSVKFFAFGGGQGSNLVGPNGSRLVRIDFYRKNCPQSPDDIFHVVRSYYRPTSPYGGDSYYTWNGDADDYKIWTSGDGGGNYATTIGLPAIPKGTIAKDYAQGLSASEEAETVKQLADFNIPANFRPCAANDDGFRTFPKFNVPNIPSRPSTPSDGCIYGQCP